MRKAAAVEQKSTAPDTLAQSSPTTSQLLQQYGCGPIPFVGTENAFYERHLVFDRVIDPPVATARECPDYFDFKEFGTGDFGDFIGALGETLEAESLTRVLYPDDTTTAGQGLRFLQEYFLVACSLADLVRRFRRHNTDWNLLPEKVAIQLNDTRPSMAMADSDSAVRDRLKVVFIPEYNVTLASDIWKVEPCPVS